ncbi:cytochrome c [Ornithobacterium rhinotracheale]|uniref:c-type cytochrome n=1 Tax=Ornithobacterium rhinotracheale TaxID=28251 RepID=UPI00129CC664|nr:cytochrome c [Ornithobacterium rhinotracheale]MRI63169.1 cytochrome c [Ornithobacterium rhinotracheale]MRJ07867.1 cytochrome c [Ornithobacterium rhinotracheale]MRJ10873.1 cytochrome c [Ornithobacterium rhinotracheale]UOH78619.1 cytochrome c [Ornithobacterium rhinotracheale]
MKKLIILAGFTLALISCGPGEKPAAVYMPDMYYSNAYEPYAQSTFGYPKATDDQDVYAFQRNHHSSALMPVEGTVAHTESGLLPYDLPNTNEGYEASKSLKSPLDSLNREQDLKRGEKLFGQACVACHGEKGDGQGPIVVSGAFLGVPNYKDREITVGSVHHVIMYGRNAMGSYASHFTDDDRWRVAEYVMQLRNK